MSRALSNGSHDPIKRQFLSPPPPAAAPATAPTLPTLSPVFFAIGTATAARRIPPRARPISSRTISQRGTAGPPRPRPASGAGGRLDGGSCLSSIGGAVG